MRNGEQLLNILSLSSTYPLPKILAELERSWDPWKMWFLSWKLIFRGVFISCFPIPLLQNWCQHLGYLTKIYTSVNCIFNMLLVHLTNISSIPLRAGHHAGHWGKSSTACLLKERKAAQVSGGASHGIYAARATISIPAKHGLCMTSTEKGHRNVQIFISKGHKTKLWGGGRGQGG